MKRGEILEQIFLWILLLGVVIRDVYHGNTGDYLFDFIIVGIGLAASVYLFVTGKNDRK